MIEKRDNWGWVCPKCGCPNAPTNKTCAACFTPTVDNGPLLVEQCSKCGKDLSRALGFICPDYCCPQRSGIKSFNPLNAAENITSLIKEEGL